MSKSVKLLAAAIAACGLLRAAPADAQLGRPPVSGRAFPSVQSRYPAFAPTQLQQSALRNWAFNTAVIGRTYARIPPWVFGYNPYPQAINYGPVVQPIFPQQPLFNPYMSPYAGGIANPYGVGVVDPYGVGAGGFSNPYGGGWGGGYDAGWNPYYGYGDPFGGYLRGSADVINAVGNLSLQQEQARMMREMALQAKLDTKKKAFDLAKYIRDNTPTFTENEAKVQKQILARVTNNATWPEIVSGRSQNILLKNLDRFVGRKSAAAPVTLDEDILKHLNVTGSFGNLGLLRNNGQFTWPAGLTGLVPDPDRTAIEQETQRVFRQAVNANLDPNNLRALKNTVSRMRETLTRSVNDVPASQYIEAQRFLNDFDSALVALESKDAARYFEFHSKFSGGPRTVQELVDYMVRNGLRFAPANAGDESAYNALQSALATYSVAVENANGNGKE